MESEYVCILRLKNVTCGLCMYCTCTEKDYLPTSSRVYICINHVPYVEYVPTLPVSRVVHVHAYLRVE